MGILVTCGTVHSPWALFIRGSRGVGTVGLDHPSPMEKYKAVDILKNTALNPHVNLKSTQPVFGVGQSSAP